MFFETVNLVVRAAFCPNHQLCFLPFLQYKKGRNSIRESGGAHLVDSAKSLKDRALDSAKCYFVTESRALFRFRLFRANRACTGTAGSRSVHHARHRRAPGDERFLRAKGAPPHSTGPRARDFFLPNFLPSKWRHWTALSDLAASPRSLQKKTTA